MPDFILNGLNNTVTNTVNFSRTSATTETAIVAPTANLYITASDWNTLFSFGEDIYHTYSGELPLLTSHAVNFTNTGNGTGAVLDYVKTDAINRISGCKFASAGARYAINDIVTFIVASQGTSKNDVSSGPHTLVAADLDLDSVKHELTGLSIATGDGNNYTAGEYVAGPNLDDGTYTDLVSYEATSAGTGATLTSITVASNQITGVAWSAAGSGYAAGDTFVFTIGGTKFATYTVLGGDLSGGAMATLTTKSIAKFITVAHAGSGSGSVVNRVTVAGNKITKIGFSADGTDFYAADTLTVTIDGTAFAALTLAATQLTGGLKTTSELSTAVAFVNGIAAAGDFVNDVITIVQSSGQGAIVDTVTVASTGITGQDTIAAITFAGRGYGCAAGDTITLTLVDTNGNTRVFAAYTLLAADVNSDGSLNDITPASAIVWASGTDVHGSSIRYNKRTLAITKLQTPAGTALQESEETEQTIADDTIRHFMYGITGNYNQQGSFSNLETINTTIDNLLTGTAALTLIAKLKTSILGADLETDADTDTGNLSRQLFLQLSSGEPARLTTNTYQQYHNDNVLSNLVGDLSGIASTTGTYTTADSINVATTGSGTGQVVESITVRDSKVVGVKFSKPGRGHAVADTLTFTATGVTFSATYSLVAGDIDSAGGLSNNLHNFLFEAGDTLTFQCTVAPNGSATNSGQTSINYAIKVTMI